MNKASRRMWARRVLRAGWMLAPVLAIPAWIKETFFTNEYGKFSILGAITFAAICFGLVAVPSCTKNQMHLDSTATAAEIKVALAGNPCMQELMPRWQANTKKPLTNRELLMGTNSCQEATGAYYEIQAQKAAMLQIQQSNK